VQDGAVADTPVSPASDESPWEHHASWWQEHFTAGADPEYEEQILPLVAEHAAGARRALEVGCGEGQVARTLAATGAAVVGVDPVASHLEVGARRGGGPSFVRGRADALPFADARFDAVVVTLVFEHLDPFEPAVAEIARVLEPGGRFVLVMNHPLLQAPGSCWVDDADFGDQYWRLGPYLREQVVEEEVAPGVILPFAYRPLGRYIHVLGAAGLPVVDMVEPPPAPSTMVHLGGFPDAATIPRLVAVVARKSAT
ncbi:MAG: class I SAM-dependent methyltransferase, partial [Gemmatimonadales bacterium]